MKMEAENIREILPNCTAATVRNTHNFHIHHFKNFKSEY